MASKRTCAFCRETGKKMSGEHLWPEWVRNRLPGDMASRNYEYTWSSGVQGEIRKSEFPLFDLRVNRVCEDCNNGWMHDLEDAVIPLLEGPLAGRQKQLHEGGLTKFAAWATMKALVFELSNPEDTWTPEDHYRAVYEARGTFRPPEGVEVFTAGVQWKQGEYELPGFFHSLGVTLYDAGEAEADPDRTDGYTVTVSYLNVVTFIFWPYRPFEGEWGFRSHIAPSIGRVWPFERAFVWPPGPLLTIRGLRALAAGRG